MNLNYDFTNFDIVNITSILQNARSDYTIRKSSLEQLTLLLFDCDQKRGKVLFSNQGVIDVFTFVVDEILSAYKTTKTYLGEKVTELPAEQITYLDQCLKFVFFAYTFFQEEKVVRTLFDKIRSFSSTSTGSEAKVEQFETILNALIFFSGCKTLRKHAMRLLYLVVFNPFWLRVKVSKLQAHAWRTKRQVTFLIPDFAQETFVLLVPTQLQVVKMPMRDDLMLSDEQKNYITTMFGQSVKHETHRSVLLHVSQTFVQSKQGSGTDGQNTNFNEVIRSFELLQNYLLSLSDAKEELLTPAVLATIQEVLRILPTRDFEFNFLSDFLMSVNQVLTVCTNLAGPKTLESLVGCLCDSLKFHLLPYMFEIGISGLEENVCDIHSPRVFFLHEFLEFLTCLTSIDSMLCQQYRIKSRMGERVLTS